VHFSKHYPVIFFIIITEFLFIYFQLLLLLLFSFSLPLQTQELTPNSSTYPTICIWNSYPHAVLHGATPYWINTHVFVLENRTLQCIESQERQKKVLEVFFLQCPFKYLYIIISSLTTFLRRGYVIIISSLSSQVIWMRSMLLWTLEGISMIACLSKFCRVF
jgi:hypothetical protein